MSTATAAIFYVTWKEADGDRRYLARVPADDADAAKHKFEQARTGVVVLAVEPEQDTIALGELEEGDAFLCPWKPAGVNVGEVIKKGTGSVTVRAPNQDCDGWDRTPWAPETRVVPCDVEKVRSQTFGAEVDTSNRSKVKGAVSVVHDICDDLKGDRKAILAECEKRGINPNTAKTQYYAWRKANA